jgi:hypothetical protein
MADKVEKFQSRARSGRDIDRNVMRRAEVVFQSSRPHKRGLRVPQTTAHRWRFQSTPVHGATNALPINEASRLFQSTHRR